MKHSSNLTKPILNKKDSTIDSFFDNHCSLQETYIYSHIINNQRLEKQKINTNDNTYLSTFLKIEEINTRIEKLVALREELKKPHQQNEVIIPEHNITKSWDEKFLYRLLQYIKNNLNDPELSVTSILSQMHISRTQLHRKLKTLTGLSTTEFIRTIRLKRAEQLLKQNADSVTQIGYQIGFSDHSYFSKCFKKEYGISPSEYSKKFQFV